jgi:hypothetical protein
MNASWFLLASSMILPLCAQTTGNINYELPPSHHEWRLLLDNNTLNATFAIDGEDSVDSTSMLQIFTHREGDALEILFFAQTDIKDEQPLNVNSFIENDFGAMGFSLPNHRLSLVNLENLEDRDIVTYVWEDGVVDLMHGVICLLKTQNKMSMLHYATTAPISEENIQKWTAVLSQASTL